jgi:serine/threonine-protein kinase
MSSEEGSMPCNVNGHGETDTGATSDEVELAQVLESYLAQLEAGEPADPEGLIAAHPKLARPLRACLKVMHLAQGLDESAASPSEQLPVDPDAFGTVPALGSSALTALWPHDGENKPPRVLLPEPPDEDSAIVRTHCDDLLDALGGVAGRYQVLGEIARGGMGMVLKARDADLGRDLALKVLLERHRGDQDVVRRFVEEAQIGGQLQHPGIVPVHELGTLADRRPFFAMRLVKGRTLAALLSERMKDEGGRMKGGNTVDDDSGASFIVHPSSFQNDSSLIPHPSSFPSDLPRFLSIFEQVCQTMAYAHARRVIHRDLKPANVMVGSFGEVQVMDWGLAKVLPEGGVADEAKAMEKAETYILTVRSGPRGSARGSESQAGSVLGTPAYMAPEQARGEVDRIDERADVFGLGAILCEILTGRPPYMGATREEVRAMAARGELADALRHLKTCGVDAELIDLARNCMRPERDRRPRNAGEVARQITDYLAGVQERLKEAELARAEAQVRAEEAQVRMAIERSRRRRTLALAAAILGLIVVGGGSSTYLARKRAERRAITERGVAAALGEAIVWRDQARKSAATGSLDHWATALAAARHARDLVAQGETEPALREQVEGNLTALEREQEAAKAERRLLDELETIRGSESEHWDPKRTDAGYAAAFRAFGIDLDQLEPNEAGKRLAQHAAAVELASYLDDWALARVTARGKKDETSWRRLAAAAQATDPDPWRVALRDQIGRGDQDALRRLAEDQKTLEAQPAASLVLLGKGLAEGVDRALAQRVLRRSWRLSAGDFWLNFELGQVHWTGDGHVRPEEATRFYSAAVAIRPRSHVVHSWLGIALSEQGKSDEAIAEFREAMGLEPGDADAHHNLAIQLCEQGKLDEAVAENREALRLKPDFALPHNGLGNALSEQGKLDEAIPEYREALRLKPDFYRAHIDLGNALRRKGLFDEAFVEYRTALRLKPDFPAAHANVGIALYHEGKPGEAIAEWREALRLKPDLIEVHINLGTALRSQGEFTQAIAELRRARELVKTNPELAQTIERELAATERQASLTARLPAVLSGKLRPGDARETLAFAQLCYEKKLHGASARFWSEAFRGQPKLADDMQAQHRYNAACAAALAGCGQGKDDPPLGETAKERSRKQALDWLKADLAAWSKVLQTGPANARKAIVKTLQDWRVDTDLAGLRDTEALKRLTAAEQAACRALWAELDALLANARAGPGSRPQK